MSTTSHLVNTASGPQLIVDGKPFLCLPGELQNSSFSSAAYMNTQWENIRDMNINTVLAAVTWEQLEAVEGHFNFAELDANIKAARSYGLRLVLLWFGSYKNGLSTYVPGWVKTDSKRFPRVEIRDAASLKVVEMLSPFEDRNCEADARAFAAFMAHLKTVDEKENTVIMVQVENEPGLLGDSRDRSAPAEEAYSKPVPADLLTKLKSRRLHTDTIKRGYPFINAGDVSSMSWSEAFGKDGEEVFMANALSHYVERVAARGKAEYKLPLFVNAWLNCDDPDILDLEGIPLKHNMTTVAGGGAKAGDYPSGGGCPHVLDIWKINAPSLDFMAPDVYLHKFSWVCEMFTQQDQPLFIPEQRRDAYGARRLMYAYGNFAALGCSPFGIDTLVGRDDLDCPFTRVFGLLAKMSKHVLDARQRGPASIMGFCFDEIERLDGIEVWTRTFGEYNVKVERAFVFGKQEPGCGMVIHLGGAEFLVFGWGFRISFESTSPDAAFTGILSARERFVDQDGELKGLRELNGDETRSGECLIMPNINPDYGGFPIAITIPAHTAIATCTAYTLTK